MGPSSSGPEPRRPPPSGTERPAPTGCPRPGTAMPQTLTAPPQMPHFDHQPRAYTGPSREEVLAARARYANPALFTLYREPLMIVEGRMQYLFDETGRRYLDLFAGIVTVSCGHCHPKVVARVREQA